MSRVIKFRAWSSVDKIMLCSDVVTPSFGAILESKNYDVMQFTGLNDKNDTEIFEGDIVIWYINGFERVGEIYYETQAFDMRSPKMGYIGWDANRGEIEVIGNIYQNPELLNQ